MSRRPLPAALAVLALTLCAPPSGAQQRLDAQNEAWRQERIAITGDLGAPVLPPVYADSPRDDLMFADRFPVAPDDSAYAGLGEPTLIDGLIEPGEGGTGTDKFEVFQYQLPAGYDANAAPVPLVIAYHGYGESAKSVANLSLVDEECNARGWLYVAPTGIDDQLFGSPVSQQNTTAAVQWMIDQHAVDIDRVYMVGFSLGGGISANFAARHRDPDGLMIAALALVSPTGDWVMRYKTGDANLKTWMEHPYNFGDKPGAALFAYQRVSALYHEKTSYPPLPGLLLPEVSMARNLGATPTWITWDEADPIDMVQHNAPALSSLLASLGGVSESHVVSGTTDGPLGQPAPHSWAVLDVEAAFDFLASHELQRRPKVFDALLDRDTAVGHVTVTQRATGAFSRVTTRDGNTFEHVSHVEDLAVDASRLAAGTVRFTMHITDGLGTRLSLSGFDERPERLLFDDGRAVHDVQTDPAAGSLSVAVGGVPATAPGPLTWLPSGMPVNVAADPSWGATLTTAPNPVTVGQVTVLAIDAGPEHPFGLVIATPFEKAQALPGGLVAGLAATPQALVVALPLSDAGRIELPIAIPSDPALKGVHVHLQLRAVDASGAVDRLSNSWMAWFQ